jgi:tetratricopeptide (TPR) repeat protein
MKHSRYLCVFLVPIVAVALAVAPAQAAGSKPKPVTTSSSDDGVEEYNEGVKLMKSGDFAEAQAKFEAALAKNGKFAEAHNNLAYSMRKQGADNYDAALEHYNRAIGLKPDLAEAYMYRGVLYSLMGDEAKALADHKALLGLDRKLANALEAAIASGEEPEGLEGLAKKW